jgi:TonB-linked SusC/RagA family outer membrane protein
MSAQNTTTTNTTNQKSITVEGTIIDDLGLPLFGATILQQGTSKGASSDANGKFVFKVDVNSNIEISYIGFKTLVVKNINKANSKLTFKMQVDASNLNEVVIVGFAKQTKKTLVGSVATLKGEVLKEVGALNSISEALQGLAPGVTIVSAGGKPGADAANIFIRGRSSWQNSNPLTLVDGIPRDLNNIDPNEIETISILKDATATAVYGVRGANGVILITTKRGKIGKTKFNFTSDIGFKESTAKPKFTDYITAQRLYNEAATNDRNWAQLIPESTINAWEQNYDQRGPYNIYFPEVDWIGEIFGTGVTQTYNLNMTGGSKLVKYFVSLGYRDDGDIFQTTPNEFYDPAFGLQRYNFRSNFDFDITSSTKLTVNFSGNYRERQQPGYRIDGNGEDGFGQAQFFNQIFTSPRNLFPLKDNEGFYGDSAAGNANIIMQLNEGGKRTYQYYQGFYDAELKQGLDFITKGLSFTGSINYSSDSNYEKRILRDGVGGGSAGFDKIRFFRAYDYSNPTVGADGTVTYPMITQTRFPDPQAQEGPLVSTTPVLFGNEGYSRKLNYKFQIDYKRTFGSHKVSTNAIVWRQSDVYRAGYLAKREEWIARVNYYYKDRYLFEANSSYSGSEKFAPGQRFGFFPSLGVGWVVSEEPLIKKYTEKWLDLFKVNYSFGISGDDTGGDGNNPSSINRFQYIQNFSTAGNVNYGLVNFSPFGPRYIEGSLANQNSTWENSEVQNVSFKGEIFKKINFSMDFYKEERSGILMDIRLPSFVGASGILATGNIGITQKQGYELEIGWKDKIGSDFNYNINFNTSFTENRIVNRNDPRLLADYLKFAGKPIGFQSRILNSGYYQSLDDIYNGPTPLLGASQGSLVPGDALFVDYNGDGLVNNDDRVPMDQTQEFPLRTYALNLGADYKGFSLSVRFYGVTDVGYTIPNNYYFDFDGNIQAGESVTTRWTPENALTAEKPALHLANAHNKTASTLTYVDGSYIRLRSAEFSYKFTKNAVNKLKLDALQLYANGNNLFTWSKLDDQLDPEATGTANYPIVKRYNFGLRVTF